MNTNTIHADGITHSLAAACAEALKALAGLRTTSAM